MDRAGRAASIGSSLGARTGGPDIQAGNDAVCMRSAILSLCRLFFLSFDKCVWTTRKDCAIDHWGGCARFSQGQLAGIVQVVIEWDPARKYEYSFVADENWEVSKALAHLCDRLHRSL